MLHKTCISSKRISTLYFYSQIVHLTFFQKLVLLHKIPFLNSINLISSSKFVYSLFIDWLLLCVNEQTNQISLQSVNNHFPCVKIPFLQVKFHTKKYTTIVSDWSGLQAQFVKRALWLVRLRGPPQCSHFDWTVASSSWYNVARFVLPPPLLRY